MRKPYKGVQDVFLVEDLVSQEPFGNFKHWFDTAYNTDGIHEANAMSLATATKLVVVWLIFDIVEDECYKQ